ncbi:uncharacterized protein YcnI [Microbacteriaceae bacterium SG_E_30_P1]|uniref:Uncharacterized protein YcnI n=1 Tax=Antiquaquibacter oligotrophicus TaxID=2880260 RepID=A0ABT6KML4_9MICO|nr:YcnI family protein [Antiquaquibacter oligotrophicus]MDH6181248.1 uncharacterized protein YcnI [Antiquaquibacter oligotrophicus]UDF13057.1 YcnI family protein [Antiquaquibacter oligotrophicus]
MNKNTISAAAVIVGATALALSAPLSASAHITASATSTAAGSYSVITFSVPHGCEASPTTAITIDIPEDILSVTPTRNTFWTFDRTMVPLDPPTDDASERTSQVIYTAITPLPSDARDSFELSVKLPMGEAGDVVEFPVTQTCEEGQELWVGEDVPSITLTAAEGDGHGHGGGHAEESEAEAETAAADAVPASSTEASGDVLARVLAGAGLIVGAAGLAFGITARRKAAK